MKHPAISEHPLPAAGSSIPWSAERELRLRKRITNIWIWMWTFLLSGVVLFSLAYVVRDRVLPAIAAMTWGAALVLLIELNKDRELLGQEIRRGANGQVYEGSGMLANKPRSTVRLTEWIQHGPFERGFVCGGHLPPLPAKHFDWETDAKWVPNFDPEHFGEAEYPTPVDAGGGRWVILCPCGLGHFKLKA